MTTLFAPPTKEKLGNEQGQMPQRWKSWFNTVFDYLTGVGQLGNVTLKLSSATTVVKAQNCDIGSVVILTPVTVHAAAEVAAGSLYVVASEGSFTIHQVNSSTTLRTFNYVILG